MKTLDLALIGNSSIGALLDEKAEVVWACFPRFDGDALFCSLLRERADEAGFGFMAVDLPDFTHAEQEYLTNTAILVTRLHDRHGGVVEVTDFSPRFRQHGRMFAPMTLVRQVRRLAGSPRIVLRVRPAHDYGRSRPSVTWGSNHIRHVTPDLTLRLTTNASITSVLEETPFFLEDTATLILGPDETLQGAVGETGRHFAEETAAYAHETPALFGDQVGDLH